MGEYALEYLNRLSLAARVYLAVEGSEDEVELIPDPQWYVRPNVIAKLNSTIGASFKATDWAPEVSVLCTFEEGPAAGAPTAGRLAKPPRPTRGPLAR